MNIKSFTQRIKCPLQVFPNMELEMVNSVSEIKDSEWTKLAQRKSIFLSIPYLQAMEEGMKNDFGFRYVTFYCKTEPIGIAVFQLKRMDSKIMNADNELSKAMEIGLKIIDHNKINLLIVGSMFNMGDVNFFFENLVDKNQIIEMINEAIKIIIAHGNKNKKTINAILLKEFELKETNLAEQYKKYSFSEFCLEPNMMLNIKKDWISFDDYLQSMTAKFRNKFSATNKKSKDVIEKDYSSDDIVNNLEVIESLFNNVYRKAKIKLGKLEIIAFAKLKAKLKDNFLFKSYWVDDKMIAFSTSIIDFSEVQANYIGLDYDYIKSHAIYQRLLYDYVKITISNKKKVLNLGRTSGEIKSTIGAKSKESVCYIRMKNTLSNHILKPMVKAMKNPEFSERDPFKK